MLSLDDAQEQGIVTGLKGVTNESRDRLDVDELLLKHPKTFNLFLLALAELQDEAESNNNKMGWFQVAGIHGLPLRDWDGVPSDKGGKGSYCPHGTILFPTWHRPYLAMMEQTIYHKMVSIANQFQQPSPWLEAVKDFRLPFWDYLRPRSGNTRFPGVKDPKYGTTGYGWDFSIPFILEVEDVMVYKPYDKNRPYIKETDLQQMKNPLFAFVFPRRNGISDAEYDSIAFSASRENTVRQDKDLTGKNNHLQLNVILAQRRESEVEILLNLLYLPYYKNYTIFSNKAVVDKKPTVFGSVEGLHDDYHGNCGGIGHMGRVPLAAFDPVFWLHHCNVDRIVATWQAINPDSWFSHQSVAGAPTENTSLLPFRCTQEVNSKGFWSSHEARKTENFGYNYTDIREASSSNNLQQRVMAKYLWSSQAYIRKGGQFPMPDEVKPLDLKDCSVFMYTEGTLDSRLSREIQVLHKQEVSKMVTASTAPIEHKILAVPELSSSQTTLNVAASPESALSPIVVKDPAKIDHDLTRGPPNKTDHELLSSKPQETNVLRQWYIDITVQKAAFDGAFTVFYFIGDFPSDPEQYATAPTIAGTTHVFTAPRAACDNCGHQAEQGLLVSDTTAISPILLDYVTNGTLNSLHPSDVIPFLKTNLHWRAKGIGNERATPSAEVPGLQVAVSSSIAYLHAESSVQLIGVQGYPEATAGRAGGLA